MSKLWLVARHQYAAMVGKRSFILVTLGFPFLIAAVMAIAVVFASGRQDRRPVGVVDQADVLIPALASIDLELRSFDTLEEAQNYAVRVIDLENTIIDKMSQLTNEEYESILRPVFKDDEPLMIAVGAVLGGVVGEIQVQFIELFTR